MAQPGWQVPRWQICAEAHRASSFALDQAVVLRLDWQDWHRFSVLTTPWALNSPPTPQPAWQLPAWQTCPEPQATSSLPLDQSVEVVAGWQVRQRLPGAWASGGWNVPAMKQPVRQVPPVQYWFVPQLVPSVRFDQATVLRDGWHDWQELPGLGAAGAR
jgi:hypothetical protein